MRKLNSPDIDSVPERERENDKRSNVKIDQFDLMEMYYRLECAVSVSVSQNTENNFDYIPYSHLKFLHTLQEVSKKQPCYTKIKFLEMGCGLGTKLYIASKVGFHTYKSFYTYDGIEINPTYAKIAQKMVGNKGTIHCVDVKDFEHYGEYDIIYTYGESTKQQQNYAVQDNVKSKMKIGATLLVAHTVCGISCWTKEGL